MIWFSVKWILKAKPVIGCTMYTSHCFFFNQGRGNQEFLCWLQSNLFCFSFFSWHSKIIGIEDATSIRMFFFFFFYQNSKVSVEFLLQPNREITILLLLHHWQRLLGGSVPQGEHQQPVALHHGWVLSREKIFSVGCYNEEPKVKYQGLDVWSWLRG